MTNAAKILLAALSILLVSGCRTDKKSEIQFTDEFHITIPGVEKEYTFLYVTDSHAVCADESEDENIRNYAEQRRGVFLDDQGQTSRDKLEELIQSTSAGNLDGLLLGGDLIDSPSKANMSLLNTILGSSQKPYLYTPGNHDWTYPWEYMTEEGRNRYLPLLSEYMDRNTAIHSLEYDKFTIVSIDDSSNQIDPACMEEYRNILNAGKPVILMLHVPLMTDSLLEEAKATWPNGVVLGGGINGGIYPNDTSAEFIRLTTQKTSPVTAILAGHVHFTHYSQVSGEKNIPQFVGGPGYQGSVAKIIINGTED